MSSQKNPWQIQCLIVGDKFPSANRAGALINKKILRAIQRRDSLNSCYCFQKEFKMCFKNRIKIKQGRDGLKAEGKKGGLS